MNLPSVCAPRYVVAKKDSSMRYLVLLGLLLVVVLPFRTWAQDAAIVGTITDSSGSVIPNVAITLTNVETGQTRNVKSNESGQYVVSDLRIGHYNIKAEASGFRVEERNSVPLSVGERARVSFEMQVGAAKQNVTVTEDAVRVQSESGEVSDVVTGQQVSQLAINGRSIYGLAALTTGASSALPDFNAPTSIGANRTISFNGARPDHNVWLVDGGEDYDRGGGGLFSIMPSPDAIAEFRSLTSNYSAEYGLGSGGTMSMEFKSGARNFHGGLWEFLRNDALDARNYFVRSPAPKRELRFHTYGFNLGGPVILPHYNTDRKKTFFFYNMEWRSLIEGGLTNQVVPNPTSYGGNFNGTGLTPHTPCLGQISAALAAKYVAAGQTLCSTMGFTNNTIPLSLLDPNAQALLGAGIFPKPTNGNNFVGGNKLPTNVREEIVRVDHKFNEKFWMFGHWVSEAVTQTYGTAQWSGDNVPTVGDTLANPSSSGVLHATYAISPSLLNEVAFNYNGNKINITPTGIFTRPTGFNVPRLFSGPNNSDRIPQINLSGTTGTNYEIASWPWKNLAKDYQIRDDISWNRGRHNLKFGFGYMLYKKTQDLFGHTQGSFGFNGNFSGNDFADFLLGYASSYQELAVQDAGRWDNNSFDSYAQDNWRVNNRLTLNLGVRWEGMPHAFEEGNRQSNFYPQLYDPTKAAILLPDGNIAPNSPGLGTSPNPILAGTPLYLNGIGIAGQNGIPTGLVNNHWAAFAPRLGFAYDLTGQGKTVIRGGFGSNYERVQGNDVYNAGPNVPFSTTVNLNNVALSDPKILVSTGTAAVKPIVPPSITGLAISNYQLPISYQYSAGVQDEIWPGAVLSVAYVGNQQRHQSVYADVNLPAQSNLATLIRDGSQYNKLVPYAGFNSIVLAKNAENAHYNSLQANFRVQATKGLTLQLAYTRSSSWDQWSGNSQQGGDLDHASNPYNLSYDNGLSSLDRPNIFIINYVYQVPFFNHSNMRAARLLLGNWELSGVTTFESGTPLVLKLGGTQGSNGLADATNRPDVNGSISYPKTASSWFNTAIFSNPAVGQFGNAPKSMIRGPGRDNWNISLFKDFGGIAWFNPEGAHLQFRVETFNTFNHTQFNNVSNTFSNSDFGKVTSAFDPRTMQLGLKFVF